jgi:uncharacterized protein with GYD domain
MYLVQASYRGEGVEGLCKDGGSWRRAAVAQACERAGGRLEAFYFAFGEHDVVAIMDLPNNVTTAGLAQILAEGKVDLTTTVLVAPEDIDEAAKAKEREQTSSAAFPG